MRSTSHIAIAVCASRLGDRLKALRDERGLTTADLADAARVSPSTMQAILDGDIARPPDPRLRALADLLGVSLQALLRMVPEGRREPESVVQGEFRSGVAVAPCAFALSPAADAASNLVEVQITPAGSFSPRDGRPMPVPAWRIDAAIASRVIERFRANATPLVVDYEHQTLLATDNGQPAPAAGFFRDLVWRDGQGLFAVIELTARAAEFVRSGEYRYFSPVFSFDTRSGAVLKLEMGALTNNPALDGMQPLALRAAARFGHHSHEDINMDLLAQLRTLLGLAETADETVVVAALTARLAVASAVRDALSLPDDATAESATAALTALRTAPAKPDPARYVPIAAVDEMRTQLATLTSELRSREIDELIAPALADGRLLSAQESWARELGGSNIAALKTYLATAQPIAALTGTQTNGRPPSNSKDENGLTPDELAVCKATGIDPTAFAKARAA
jgi:phage I-like protein/DNA-binding XRE family transcriptional regulator